jgi:cytochrome bd ubiquinol oxidase subunit I
MTAELIHRLHFAFTITFHYLFPQLTMGLGLLIVVLKTVALRNGSEMWDRAAQFWGRIFGINFVFGVVTGIPWSSSSAPTGRSSRTCPAV